MEAEYNTFLKELEKKEPKEIIAASYEKVFKEDILMIFSEHEFQYDRAKALLRMDYPLEELYQTWRKQDVTYKEDVEKKIKRFKKTIEKGEVIEEFSREIFESVVNHVIVGRYDEEGNAQADRLTFVYKTGQKSTLAIAWIKCCGFSVYLEFLNN